MKKQILLGSLVLLTWASAAQATLVINYVSGALNQAIPDANPAGVTFSGGTYTGLYNGVNYVDGVSGGINNVTVNLNITGGFNGDLYGYLVLQTGSGSYTSVLLNRVGRNDGTSFGSSTGGFGSITLSTAATFNIHDFDAHPAAGTYLADGRTVDPNGTFSPGMATPAQLNVFNTHTANGTWTLFLADLAGGDVSTLVSWGLEVSVVPEPTTWAMIGFGALLVGGRLLSFRRRVA
jgi:subtilisin-like proprotein convertase family protein